VKKALLLAKTYKFFKKYMILQTYKAYFMTGEEKTIQIIFMISLFKK